jgi:hypothetical protein
MRWTPAEGASAPASTLSRIEYNLRSFTASAMDVRDVVMAAFPTAAITFAVDEKRQAIVDTWPADVDDSAAREDWGFEPTRLRTRRSRVFDAHHPSAVPP